MLRTVKVKLDLTQEALRALSETIEQYATVYSEHVAYYNASKALNPAAAQKAIYHDLRAKHPRLPAQFIPLSARAAKGALKSFHSNFPDRKWQKVPVYRAKRINYDLRVLSLRGDLLSFSTVEARAKAKIELPEWFVDRYPERSLKYGTIGVNRRGEVHANLAFTIPEVEALTEGKTIGLDRGIINLVATSSGELVSGKKVRGQRRRHLFVRRSLQAKGTKASKRRLRARSGQEMRFSQDVNHQVSKELASKSGIARYVLEDLVGISKSRPQDKYKKKSNKRKSDWAHGQLLEFLTYKCEAKGIELAFVNPAWTSQECSRCGSRSKDQRNGGYFCCKRCGLRIHADYNASLNILQKWVKSTSSSPRSKQPGQDPSHGSIDLWVGAEPVIAEAVSSAKENKQSGFIPVVY